MYIYCIDRKAQQADAPSTAARSRSRAPLWRPSSLASWQHTRQHVKHIPNIPSVRSRRVRVFVWERLAGTHLLVCSPPSSMDLFSNLYILSTSTALLPGKYFQFRPTDQRAAIMAWTTLFWSLPGFILMSLLIDKYIRHACSNIFAVFLLPRTSMRPILGMGSVHHVRQPSTVRFMMNVVSRCTNTSGSALSREKSSPEPLNVELLFVLPPWP